MKKSFMFVAVAAVGMLASCSSESLTAGSDPKIETDQEELVPIEINVANSVSTKAETRGEGPVGDTEASGNNKWQGQKVKVFMFNKNGLSLALEDPNTPGSALYNNTELTTPTNETTGLALEYTDATHVKHRYYPPRGNFDFWGYYIDNAGTAAAIDTVASEIVDGDKDVKVPFVIDGTQDLMVAKAVLTGPQATTMNALPVADQTRYYSAFAARKQVQPDMTFKHLLTQLKFTIQGGNQAACGWSWRETATPGVYSWFGPTTGKKYTGVFVKSIKIKSQNSGYIVAAYTRSNMTGDTRFQDATKLIKFDDTATPPATDPDNYVDFELKGAGGGNLYGWSPIVEGDLTVTDPGDDHYNSLYKPTATPTDAATYNTPFTYNPVSVGGAMLVQPRDSYVMEIELGQYLLDVEDKTNPASSTYVVKPSTISDIPVALTSGSFEPGKIYNINVTVWGNEEIRITTTLEAWMDGGSNIEIDAE